VDLGPRSVADGSRRWKRRPAGAGALSGPVLQALWCGGGGRAGQVTLEREGAGFRRPDRGWKLESALMVWQVLALAGVGRCRGWRWARLMGVAGVGVAGLVCRPELVSAGGLVSRRLV